MTLRIAIAHDYLTQRGGAERVVLAMARTFPDAPIYTTFYDPSSTYAEFAALDVRTTWINRLPALRNDHRRALPIMPLGVRRGRIDADVLLCSSSGWAHGFRTTGRKVVYCYSPARWLYQQAEYLGDNAPALRKGALRVLRAPLMRWDRQQAGRADAYLAISTVVRRRIWDTYGVSAAVLAAPHTMGTEPKAAVDLPWQEPFFVCLSRLLPYKNVEAVVRAFAGMSSRLVVVGRGPEKQRLASLATENVVFLQDLQDEQLRWLYSRAVAVISSSFEDFGLTPLEGAAFGKPSVVLNWGGFLDTVVEGVTGTFFDSPTPDAIRSGVVRLLSATWEESVIMAHANKFSEAAFANGLRQAVAAVGGAAS